MKTGLASGQSLFEVLVAVALTSIILIAIVSLTSSAVKNASLSKNKSLAEFYKKEAIDWLRGERDSNWNVFTTRASATGTLWCIRNITSWPGTSGACGATDYISGTNNLKRQVTLTLDNSSNPQNIDAVVEVNWGDTADFHNERTVTTLSKWKQLPYIYPTSTPTPTPVIQVVNNSASGDSCDVVCGKLVPPRICQSIGINMSGDSGNYYRSIPSCGASNTFILPPCATSMVNQSVACGTNPVSPYKNQTMWTNCRCI